MAERYAIYYAPAATGTLWERACTWLGRDPQSGDTFEGPVAGIDRDRLLNLTQNANRYGFHATLKAPMALADGTDGEQLREALAAFAARHQAVPLGSLRLVVEHGFLFLHAPEAGEPLQDFAAHVVEDFEPFRAPLSVKDHAARVAKGLTPRQEEMLDAYGYPYVFEEFRFHLTLSDTLGVEDAADLLPAAATWFNPVLDAPVVLDRLSLFVERDRGAPFMRVADFPLGAAS